ncbi:hypothetical protein BVX94_00390, partial [bacterium B17]
MTNQLAIENLSVEYPSSRGKPPVQAVTDVSLQIAAGESVGLVGESGCGKTTLANNIVGLVAPTKGKVMFDYELIASDCGRFSEDARKKIQM